MNKNEALITAVPLARRVGRLLITEAIMDSGMTQRNASVGNMIKRIAGLQNTTDTTAWEDNFIQSVLDKTDDGKNTLLLSGKQVEIIERIHNKHFA